MPTLVHAPFPSTSTRMRATARVSRLKRNMPGGALAVVQARLDDATARERMLNERMLKLEREFLNLKNPPSGATCLGAHLDDDELRRVSEEVIASIRNDMTVSKASSKRVGSKFIRDKILDSVGIHVKREVSDLWSRCVKQFNIPVTEKRDFNECDRRALDAWLTKEQEVIRLSGEEAAAAQYLLGLSLTQGSDSHEDEGTKLKETSDDEYRIVTGKDDVPKTFEDARKQGKNYFATTPVKKDRKKRTPWTLEEHQLFLTGLEKFGKGQWKQISRALVTTRSPQQVASHAQKFYKQQHASEVEDTSAYLPQSLKRPSTGSVTTPAKKTKPKIEDLPARFFHFEYGQMVWARVGKSDWWPGTIQDVCGGGKYTVRYYQPFGRTTPPIPCKNIELYTESDEKHLFKRCSRRPHSKLFNDTVANARRAFQKHSI